jgi:hypothetical protein
MNVFQFDYGNKITHKTLPTTTKTTYNITTIPDLSSPYPSLPHPPYLLGGRFLN